MVFLLLTLALPLLHLAQATTCQGDNCPTGLIITGGAETETSIETFPADDPSCNIPPFPARRQYHSLSVVDNGRQLVACGGDDRYTRKSCISWRSGQDEWTEYATLRPEKGRENHAAVVMKGEKIIVIGGRGSARTTGEIVKGETQFPLQNGGYGTCAVAYQTGFLTIGGTPGEGDSDVHGKVDRYDSEGNYLGSLPDLAKPRRSHGCTSFLTDNGEQALLVAGGWNHDGELSSTELFSNGRWTTGGNLPRALWGLKAGFFNQLLVVSGGRDDEYNYRDEVLLFSPSTNAWTEIGKLKMGRAAHAIAEVNLRAVCPVIASSATKTTGLDPLLALLICLFLVSCRRCNNSCTSQGEKKQSL